VRQALKNIVKVAKKYGWEVAVPGGLILDVLLQVLTPSELDPNEDEAVKHWMAEHDYAGGKPLEEIRAHPGGEGYQEHHFLENTEENQKNLPEGFRDAPENKGKIPTLSHEELHAELSSKDPDLDHKILRDSLRGKSVEEQLESMFKLMRKLRILK
jgi:hypothetical protein